ncbi:MAG: hypothetical protein DMF83_29195 [Acidobacteria bacterium]|nr:MAG: hypothetical protein DMF83_29195 [Acidobacteriota bacterium]
MVSVWGIPASMRTSVLILGHHRQSLTVVRSLARAGFAVIIGSAAGRPALASSRFVSELWMHPPTQAEEFVTALVDFLRRRDITYVFPVGESELACLMRHHAPAAAYSTIVMPKPAVVSRCLDKATTYQIVSRLGIPAPKTEGAKDLFELLERARDVRFPCIVKPRTSLQRFYDRKAIVCRTQAELIAAFADWPEAGTAVLVQEFVNGARYNCEFAAVNGRLIEYFEHKVLRSDRADELGVEVEGVSVPPTRVLVDYCERLLVELDYSGVGCVQFLVDESGRAVSFLEVNPRLDATCALPWHFGCDLPRVAVEIAAGKARVAGPAPAAYPIAKRIHWCSGDLAGFMHEVRRGRMRLGAALTWLTRIAISSVRADCHLTWWWKDPIPSFVLYRDLFMTWLSLLARRGKPPRVS